MKKMFVTIAIAISGMTAMNGMTVNSRAKQRL